MKLRKYDETLYIRIAGMIGMLWRDKRDRNILMKYPHKYNQLDWAVKNIDYTIEALANNVFEDMDEMEKFMMDEVAKDDETTS